MERRDRRCCCHAVDFRDKTPRARNTILVICMRKNHTPTTKMMADHELRQMSWALLVYMKLKQMFTSCKVLYLVKHMRAPYSIYPPMIYYVNEL
jgi:hypothetical protein